MSRQFSVIVLCPNGRRETLKISSNCSILQILEEACMKQNLNPGDFDLWHYKKSLDLSLPLRFANLPNNALLELQPAKNPRKDSMITVALQLESGERIMRDFTSSTTLYDIIKQYSQTASENIEEKGEPVCIYMRQQIIGEAIKTTTLRNLGLMEGSAIIRLLHRKPEQLGNQAHVSCPLTATVTPMLHSSTKVSNSSDYSINQLKSSTGELSKEEQNCSSLMETDQNENSFSGAAENKDTTIVFKKENPSYMKNVTADGHNETMECENTSNINAIDFLNQPNDAKPDLSSKEFQKVYNSHHGNEVVNIECDSEVKEEVEEIGEINYIGDRHAVLYSLDDITDIKKADLPDEFFELTVNDVRYLMEEFKRERVQMENQPLLTKEQRDRQILQKLSHYSQTVIRVYFPERLVIQAVFMVTETIQNVCNFLKNYLENQDLNFYLYTTPPKQKLNVTKSLLESMLVPAAVIYFGCDTQLPNYLISGLKNKKSDPRAAALAASESRKGNASDQELEPSSPIVLIENVPSSSNQAHQPDPCLPKSAKIPKWMQLSKK